MDTSRDEIQRLVPERSGRFRAQSLRPVMKSANDTIVPVPIVSRAGLRNYCHLRRDFDEPNNRRSFMNLRGVLAAFALVTPQIGSAITCEGVVSGTSIEPTSGDVFVENIGAGLGNARLCSVISTKNSIQPEACKVVYSTLLVAQSSGRSVAVKIPTISSCTVTAWESVPFTYLKLK